MAPIITVENLSKRYVIDHQRQEGYTSLRDVLARSARSAINKLTAPSSTKRNDSLREEFWALKDVNFEIHEGDRVGIIGRNGAGKSTLLKILSRITEPTSGKITLKGRVASLLEVGTGFHPELTGRENIYLNGAILGMNRAEIKRKFDEIVAFAEVEKFLDTPVKRYSSGMYVRLAFSVAAHLEPEILVVDEVLAVGDIQFQKKCLGRMEEVASSGKTILLVSHNMPTILSLSNKVLLLSEGSVAEYGSAHNVVKTFQDGYRDSSFKQSNLAKAEHYGNGLARFRSIQLSSLDSSGKSTISPTTGCDMVFSIELEAYQDLSNIVVALTVYDDLGARLIDANTLIKGGAAQLIKGKITEIKFVLKNVRLKPDVYTVGLWMGAMNQFDTDGVRYATSFRMEANREDILFTPPFPGVYSCEFEYSIL